MKITPFDDRLHILNSHKNVLSVIKDIVTNELQEDAFYVCDIGDVVRKHKLWKAKLPRVEPFYAVKCNDSLAVLEVLAALGTGFDCASKNEINKILSLGVEQDRIIFANPAKPASHIRHAASCGVKMMTFDNEIELHKIKQYFPDSKLVIRIRYDAADVQCQLGMKFGCDAITEAPELIRLAKSLDLDVIGVSFHVGSGCRDAEAFRKAIALSRDVFDLAETVGYRFQLLDIGGGYPGNHLEVFENIANVINSALDDYFPEENVQIIAEPGRFYVSSAYTLACNVHSIRTIPSNSDPNKLHRMYYINDGVYGSFNCILYDHQEVVPQPLNDYPGSKYYESSIWGPTCDGLDQVADNIMLPDMNLGDWIIFEDMGAYTLPVASPFNGFPVPKVHIVADENIWLLLEDLVTLSDKHFEMIMAPVNLKMKKDNLDNVNNNDSFTLPSFPIRIPIAVGVQDNIIEFVGQIE